LKGRWAPRWGRKAPWAISATSWGREGARLHGRREEQADGTSHIDNGFAYATRLHFGLWKIDWPKAMTIYRTRYRDPKERRWLSRWAETRVTAEFWRAEIERRYAPRKVDALVERFELNPGKSDIVRFLNEHTHE
jgi:hypothetical protein